MSTHTLLRFPAGFILFVAVAGAIAGHDLAADAQSAATPARPAGWEAASHGSSAKPDYGRVFSTDVVHELRVTIPATVVSGHAGRPARGTAARTWRARHRSGTGGSRAGRTAAGGGSTANATGAGSSASGSSSTTRAWKRDCDCACAALGQPRRCVRAGTRCPRQRRPQHDHARSDVRRRFPCTTTDARGPMSACATRATRRWRWRPCRQSGKIPFRLDFDRYEDEYPEIRNQRFYGFSKLTFSSNFGDDSQIREAFATEVFRDRGVPAARAAFYRVSSTGRRARSTGASTR